MSQNRQVHHLLAGLSTTVHSNKAWIIQENTPENEIADSLISPQKTNSLFKTYMV